MLRYRQNRIVESRLTLPVVAVATLILWCVVLCFKDFALEEVLPKLGILSLSTYLMMLLNNENALIRIYSRMVSCMFLLISTSAIFNIISLRAALCQLGFIIMISLLFKSYQDRSSTGLTFYAFLCLGLISMVYIKVLYLVPFLWVMMITFLMSFSIGTISASVLGVLTPYWFVGCIALVMKDSTWFEEHFAQIFTFSTDISELSVNEVILFTVLFVFGVLGAIHFILFNYQDKIRTRLFYYLLIELSVLIGVMTLLQPCDSEFLLPILIVTVSPLIAHFVSLTHSRLSNITFHLLILAILYCIVFNLWTPSLTF